MDHAMGINIKNPETERLIRELAQKTGKSQTEAVTSAVREQLDRLRVEQSSEVRLARMKAIVDEIAPRLKGMPDHDEYLYDAETGLPK
jgi:antitoxin VapB